MKHHEIQLPQAAHQWCFVQATDPAANPANSVAAFKGWFDTTEQRLKFRNSTNTAWVYIGLTIEVP